MSDPVESVKQLAAKLPRYTVIAGHPGAATDQLLVGLARSLAARDEGWVIVLDPDRQQSYVFLADAEKPRRKTPLSWPVSLRETLEVMEDSLPPRTALLIKTPERQLEQEREECRAALEIYLRRLRARGHCVVLSAHTPLEIPEAPCPNLFCLFALRAAAHDWASAYPFLGDATRRAAHGQAAYAGVHRCVLIDEQASEVGSIEVGGPRRYPGIRTSRLPRGARRRRGG